jgi:hypothetical protein
MIPQQPPLELFGHTPQPTAQEALDKMFKVEKKKKKKENEIFGEDKKKTKKNKKK